MDNALVMKVHHSDRDIVELQVTMRKIYPFEDKGTHKAHAITVGGGLQKHEGVSILAQLADNKWLSLMT
jgi:hypothetical protein